MYTFFKKILVSLFLRGGNFKVVGTVPVAFSFVNFSRDIVGLETDEKQIRLCEAVDHSFKLVKLDFVSILTGFCLRLQPASTGITGAE